MYPFLGYLYYYDCFNNVPFEDLTYAHRLLSTKKKLGYFNSILGQI